jgi:hypothetical protein
MEVDYLSRKPHGEQHIVRLARNLIAADFRSRLLACPLLGTHLIHSFETVASISKKSIHSFETVAFLISKVIHSFETVALDRYVSALAQSIARQIPQLK